MSGPVTVLVADDNGVVRSVLRDTLQGEQNGISVVAEAANGRETIDLATRLHPDVTLLDHRMPVQDGLSVVTTVSAVSRVLMLTRTADEQTVLAAIRGGASGYLVHGQFNPAELIRAVHAVAGGQAHLSPTAAQVLVSTVRSGGRAAAGSGLSPRQRQIMEMIAAGQTNADIAQTLELTEKTVRNQVSRIYDALRVRNRAEAVRHWHGPA